MQLMKEAILHFTWQFCAQMSQSWNSCWNKVLTWDRHETRTMSLFFKLTIRKLRTNNQETFDVQIVHAEWCSLVWIPWSHNGTKWCHEEILLWASFWAKEVATLIVGLPVRDHLSWRLWGKHCCILIARIVYQSRAHSAGHKRLNDIALQVFLETSDQSNLLSMCWKWMTTLETNFYISETPLSLRWVSSVSSIWENQR